MRIKTFCLIVVAALAATGCSKADRTESARITDRRHAANPHIESLQQLSIDALRERSYGSRISI
ncbi:MAG: hypothetical protein OEO82_10940, partial [Gammaproteobacteria bacterium]|nr:hypothetical protein [Gammaproteobacteria bacterium]